MLYLINVINKYIKFYNHEERTNLIFDNEELLEQINETELKHKIYYKQHETVKEIVNSFINNKNLVFQLVIGQTQSGKTGTMLAVIKKFIESHYFNIPPENIYIITGLSSIDWKTQTIGRLPSLLHNRILHRNDLNKYFFNEIKMKKNVLILIDEVHIACLKNQTMYKFISKSFGFDLDNLVNSNIKICEFTATPDGIIFDLYKSNEFINTYSTITLLKTSSDYTSYSKLLKERKIKQCKNITDDKNLDNNFTILKNTIKTFKKFKYHIIRIPKGSKKKDNKGKDNITMDNFYARFPKNIYIYQSCFDDDDDGKNFNKFISLLNNRPKKHTFIFIKERFRCAVSLPKKHIGIVYERLPKNVNDSVICQGLIGRMTGYEQINDVVIFTNKESIKKYVKFWNSLCNKDKSSISEMKTFLTELKWTSNSTNYSKRNKETYSRGTFNDPPLYGLKYEKEKDKNKNLCHYKKLKSFDESNEYFINKLQSILGGNKFNKRKPDNDGYYRTGVREKGQVRILSYMLENYKTTLNEKHNKHLYPCYEDINDKKTLVWLLCWYDINTSRKM
jgi:hypothetical protein